MSSLSEYIFIVSGLPRSGTSLLMSLVGQLGVPLLTDDVRKPDSSNPKGFFEYEPVKTMYKGENRWLEFAKGKCVKIISPLLPYLSPQYNYYVLFINREIREIIKSQKVMRNVTDANNIVDDSKLMENYKRHLMTTERWLSSQKNIQVIYFDFNKIIAKSPEELEKLIKSFQPFNIKNNNDVFHIIEQDLYRNRL
jgi:hypothetical protein